MPERCEAEPGHSFDAQRYRAWSGHQREWGKRLLGQMGLRGDERVIDLGCGDGLLTAMIAGEVPRGSVLGVDASIEMIEEARKLEAGNLRFEVLDVSLLSFDGEFDLAFSNAALHWVLDHGPLLRRIRRALEDDGRVYLNFAADGNCSNLFRVVREEMASARFRGQFEGFTWPWFTPTVGEYEGLVEEAGFSEISVTSQIADRHFSRDELVNWIEQPSLVPFLEHISDVKARKEFNARVVDRMVEETRQPDGTYFETFRRVNVVARR